MSCEQIQAVLNDYLNKTLSEKEELLVKRHLEKCASCRSEYYNLLHADKALRQVICEMVAEIDVPHGLSVNIERAIARENRSRPSGLVMLLKTPLVAAALLFVVMAAVLGAYQNHFNPFAQKQVARQVQDEERPADGVLSQVDAGNSTVKEKEDAPAEVSPSNQQEVLPDQGLKEEEQESIVRQQALALKEPEERSSENMQGIQGGQPVEPIDEGARRELNAPQSGGEEQGDFFVTSAPPAGSGGAAAANSRILNDETSAEKRDAIDGSGLDFVPTKPHYLPMGAVPVNVSPTAGGISREFQVGDRHFTVKQTRLGADDQGLVKKSTRVANVDVVDINGRQGLMEKSEPGQGDLYAGTITTLKWRQDDWAFVVSGDLPAEEIIKISKSLR